MMEKSGHLYFRQMRELLLLPMTIHINEYSMVDILYFSKFAKITGVRIKMDTSKEKVINVHIRDENFIHSKACAEGIFNTNIDDPSMITNPTNFILTPPLTYPPKNKLWFFTDSEVEGARKVRKLQQHIYWPGTSNFKTYPREGMICN